MAPFPTAAFAVLCAAASIPVSVGQEANADAKLVTEPFEIKQAADFTQLPAGTTSVAVSYYRHDWEGNQFADGILALARNPMVSHLRLRIPNKSFAKDADPLRVLREFKSLESLEVIDSREVGGGLYEHLAEMGSLKSLHLEFF